MKNSTYFISTQKNVFVHLLKLLQLENTNKENIEKLLNFAKENQLKLSVMDDYENNFSLPGKPLSEAEFMYFN